MAIFAMAMAGLEKLEVCAPEIARKLKLLANVRRVRMLAGSKHEILQEQDHYRGQFWAAFNAFVPARRCFRVYSHNRVW